MKLYKGGKKITFELKGFASAESAFQRIDENDGQFLLIEDKACLLVIEEGHFFVFDPLAKRLRPMLDPLQESLGIQMALAYADETPPSMLECLADGIMNADVFQWICMSERATKRALSVIFEKRDKIENMVERTTVLVRLANHPKATRNILVEIGNHAKDYDAAVLKAVARHPRSPVETLQLLAEGDFDKDVKTYLAKNGNTPASALALLASSVVDSVRYYVGKHPNATNGLLVILRNDGSEQVRDVALHALASRGIFD